MDEGGIKLPDPEIWNGLSWQFRCSELAPDLVLAGSNRRIADIAASLPQGGMQPLKDYSLTLRKEARLRFLSIGEDNPA